MDITPHRSALTLPVGKLKIKYLSLHEVDALTATFQVWFDQATRQGKQRLVKPLDPAPCPYFVHS